MDELVSVIIATYNRPALLTQRSLPSVLAQTYTNLDIHVVGDGAGWPVVEAMSKITDPRVRFTNIERFHYPPGELEAWHVSGANAGNYALDNARGEWCCCIGDDDEYKPTYVEKLVAACHEQKMGAAFSRSEVVVNGKVIGYMGAPPPRFAHQAGGELLWRACDVRFDPESWRRGLPSDWVFWESVIDNWGGVAFVDEALYRYHPSKHIPPVQRT
jgi:glycosyltransferase involved in cell wall biosynthesis